jgi:hypothetical protein
MEIALQRFQDLFSSIGHKARCRYQIKELEHRFCCHILILQYIFIYLGYIMPVANVV